jgi:hypothetical protein
MDIVGFFYLTILVLDLTRLSDREAGTGTPTSATSGSASALPSMQASTPTQMVRYFDILKG